MMDQKIEKVDNTTQIVQEPSPHEPSATIPEYKEITDNPVNEEAVQREANIIKELTDQIVDLKKENKRLTNLFIVVGSAAILIGAVAVITLMSVI